MSCPLFPGLALVFMSAGIVTALYLGSDTRSGEAMALSSTARRVAAWIAWIAGAGQLALSAAWIGAATGPTVVLSAWMAVGLAFVLSANAWPRQSCGAGLALGLTGLALAALAWLA